MGQCLLYYMASADHVAGAWFIPAQVQTALRRVIRTNLVTVLVIGQLISVEYYSSTLVVSSQSQCHDVLGK